MPGDKVAAKNDEDWILAEGIEQNEKSTLQNKYSIFIVIRLVFSSC